MLLTSSPRRQTATRPVPTSHGKEQREAPASISSERITQLHSKPEGQYAPTPMSAASTNGTPKMADEKSGRENGKWPAARVCAGRVLP